MLQYVFICFIILIEAMSKFLPLYSCLGYICFAGHSQ